MIIKTVLKMKSNSLFCLIFLVASASAFRTNVQNSKPNGRIVGGYDVDIDQAPYQASILVTDGTICSGAVISEFHVLTSGYCTYRFLPNQLHVRAGTSYHDRFGQVVGVRYVYVHTLYNANKALHDYDVAILRVSPSLLIGLIDHILPASLPPSGILWGDDLIVNVTGWGESASASSVTSYLQGVSLEVLPSLDCVRVFSTDFNDRMLCIGVEGGSRVSPCNGDSGDPVVLTGSTQLVGVASFQQDNCMSPAVITNLADPDIRYFIEYYTGL